MEVDIVNNLPPEILEKIIVENDVLDPINRWTIFNLMMVSRIWYVRVPAYLRSVSIQGVASYNLRSPSGCVWDGSIDKLMKFDNLTALDIWTYERTSKRNLLTDKKFHYITKLGKLKQLSVYLPAKYPVITKKGLFSLTSLTGLQDLTLSSCKQAEFMNTGDYGYLIGHLTQLTQLKLSATLDPTIFWHLLTLTNLKTLSLTDMHLQYITQDVEEAFGCLEAISQSLESLTLKLFKEKKYWSTKSHDLIRLSALTNLTALDLRVSESVYHPYGYNPVSAFNQQCTSLTHLKSLIMRNVIAPWERQMLRTMFPFAKFVE